MPRGGRRPGAGRKPISIETHLARNTYRRDRHGPIPVELPAPVPAATVATPEMDGSDILAGLGPSGAALVRSHMDGLGDWDPRSLALLRIAAEHRDRQMAIAAAIATGGVVIEGRPSPLLRAERQAAGLVLAALRCLDIRPAPAVPAARRA